MDPAVLPSPLAFRLCNCDYIYLVDSRALTIAVKIYHLSSTGILALNFQQWTQHVSSRISCIVVQATRWNTLFWRKEARLEWLYWMGDVSGEEESCRNPSKIRFPTRKLHPQSDRTFAKAQGYGSTSLEERKIWGLQQRARECYYVFSTACPHAERPTFRDFASTHTEFSLSNPAP